MLVLLGISSLAAALAPVPRESGESTSSTTSTTERPGPGPTGGKLVRRTIDAQARRPERIRVSVGDQLALTVRSKRVEQFEIPGLGLIEDAGPLSPARFNLLAEREGGFEVRQVGGRGAIGVIRVDRARSGDST